VVHLFSPMRDPFALPKTFFGPDAAFSPDKAIGEINPVTFVIIS
jgi:hypothetical protein